MGRGAHVEIGAQGAWVSVRPPLRNLQRGSKPSTP